MRRELHYFDIYPKTVLNGAKSHITVRALGTHAGFTEGKTYKITLIPMFETFYGTEINDYPVISVVASRDILEFDYCFTGEQEYSLRVVMDDEGKFILLRVYSLDADLYGRIPLKGDLHVHSCFSDGAEKPEMVAANYRRAGYDFLVISDHWNYGGSVAAQKFYEGIPIDINIINGEEVHAPGNHIHVVNFGGEHSVNKLFEDEAGEQYEKEVQEIADGLSIPADAGRINKYQYASCIWVSEKIRKANGLSIFAHPFWIVDAYYIHPDMTRYLLKTGVFDALELLGGLTPRENMMSLALYHTEKALGNTNIPVVGSSDSHGTVREGFSGSWFSNPVDNEYGYFDFHSIVFAASNDKDEIISSIKQGYSTAVDSYPGESHRVYGDFRMVSYALFLISEYFPLHQEECFEEGRQMREFAVSRSSVSLGNIKERHGRIDKFWEKYFDHLKEAGHET